MTAASTAICTTTGFQAIFVHFPCNPLKLKCYQPNVKDQETKAQRGKMASPRPDSWQVVELGFETRLVRLRSPRSQPIYQAIWFLYFLEHCWGDKDNRLFINWAPLLQPYIKVDETGSFHTASLLPPHWPNGGWTTKRSESPTTGTSLLTNPGVKPVQMKGQPMGELKPIIIIIITCVTFEQETAPDSFL